MESLGDILRRLPARRASQSTSGNGVGYQHQEEDKEPCPICKGRGWVSRKAPVGHPEFGEVFPCDCQDGELQGQRLSRLHRYSNLGALSRISFAGTKSEGRHTDPESRKLFQTALQAAEEFAEEPRGWLVYTGPSGSGKTHLAAAIANRCIERGQPVFFSFVPDFLDYLRGTFAPDSAVSYDELFNQARNTPVLVLDDVGSHSSTPWAQEKLFQVLNHRFNSLLPTVITVRGSLQRLDEGIRIRLEVEGFSTIHSLGRRRAELLRLVGSLTQDMRERMTFDHFKLYKSPTATEQEYNSLKFAFETARGFAEAPKGWLLLTGLNGCGKTHLAVAIIKRDPQTRSACILYLRLNSPRPPSCYLQTRQPDSVRRAFRAGENGSSPGVGRPGVGEQHTMGRGKALSDYRPPPRCPLTHNHNRQLHIIRAPRRGQATHTVPPE